MLPRKYRQFIGINSTITNKYYSWGLYVYLGFGEILQKPATVEGWRLCVEAKFSQRWAWG